MNKLKYTLENKRKENFMKVIKDKKCDEYKASIILYLFQQQGKKNS